MTHQCLGNESDTDSLQVQDFSADLVRVVLGAGGRNPSGANRCSVLRGEEFQVSEVEYGQVFAPTIIIMDSVHSGLVVAFRVLLL